MDSQGDFLAVILCSRVGCTLALALLNTVRRLSGELMEPMQVRLSTSDQR